MHTKLQILVRFSPSFAAIMMLVSALLIGWLFKEEV